MTKHRSVGTSQNAFNSGAILREDLENSVVDNGIAAGSRVEFISALNTEVGAWKLAGSEQLTAQLVDKDSLGVASMNGIAPFKFNPLSGAPVKSGLVGDNVDTAPVITNAALTAQYTENASGTVLAPDLQIADANDTTLISATVRISSGAIVGDLLSAMTTGTNITSTYDSATATLQLTGIDSLAHYQQVLSTVSFSSNSENPTNFNLNTTRTVTWQLNSNVDGFSGRTDMVTGSLPRSVALSDFNGDGKLDMVVANESSKTISILLGSGNGGFGAKTDFAVGDGPGFVCVGDVNGDGKSDVVVANYTSNNVSVLLGNGLGGFASKANFSTGNGPHAIALGDFNGDGKLDIVAGNYESTTVAVLLGNGAGSFGAKTTYVVGDGPSAIAVADFNGDGRDDIAAVNYSDYGNVAILLANSAGGFAAKTSFKTGFGAAGVAKGDFNGDGKLDLAVTNSLDKSVSMLLGDGTGSFGPKTDFRFGSSVGSPAVGDFNRDGKLDLAVGNEASNQVSVLFGNGAGSFGGRTDLVVVGSPYSVAVGDLNGDGRLDIAAASYSASKASALLNSTSLPSAIQQTTIVVTAANDASLITGTYEGSVIEAGGVANSKPGIQTVSGSLTCTDIDNPPNIFQLVSAGTASSNAHGTYAVTVNGDWFYTLNNNDSAVQALKADSTLTDHITVASQDGTQKVVTITIKGSNDVPVVSTSIADVVHAQSTQLDLPIALNTFFDPDLGDVLTYRATLANGAALPDWLTFNVNTLTFSGIPANDDVGTKDIQVTVTDTEGASVSEVFTLRIINVNDAPTVSFPLSDVIANEHQLFNFVVPANTFSEVDVGDVLTYHASLSNGVPLPAWLSFDSATRTFSGTPGNSEIGTLDVLVFVTDTENGYASDTFRITFNNVNDSPVSLGTLPNASVTEDSAFMYVVPENSFSDADIGDVLTYSATLANGNPLPAWLNFNPINHTFHGIPGNESVGVNDIRVIVTDILGATASSVFALTINNLNDIPALVTPLPDVTVNEDALFNLVVPANTFADIDVGDKLSYSAQMANGSPLPAWILFNATTLTFTGTASNSEVGEFALQVTASDQTGASISDIFSMTVNNVNDAPTVSSALHDINLDQNNRFDLVVPNSTFVDVDLGDTLRYSAKLANGNNLPAWLSFDANTNTFSGTPGNEAVGTNLIQVTATDNSGASVIDVFSLSVWNVNDAPTLNLPLTDVSATERESFSFVIPLNTFSDVDVGDVLAINAMLANGDPLPTWLHFDANTKKFSGTPTNDDVGTIDVLVFVTDIADTHASDIFRITVNNSNDAPVVANALTDTIANEDANFLYVVPSNAYSDVDAGDVLSFSAQLANGNALPAWLNFNSVSKTFSGMPGNDDVGSLDVKVTATDIAGASVSDIFSIKVNNTNDVPTLVVPLVDASATEDASFNYVVPSNSFGDVDAGDVLSFSAQLANGNALPAWLNFNSVSKTFSGTPSNNDVGSLDVKVTATDIAGASVSDIFSIRVNNTNDVPTLIVPLVDASATEDASFNYVVPSNSFGDVDAGDVLSFSAQLANGNALPAWLNFNSASKTFSGTPSNNDVGSLDVKVTATDIAGASVSDIFSIKVNNTNDVPTLIVPLVDASATEDASFNYVVPSNSFGDVDAGDVLSFSAQLANGNALPAWLNFNSASKTFSGTPGNNDVGNLDVKVITTDIAGASVSDIFSIKINNTNDAPAIGVALADVIATEDTSFTYSIPSNAFADVDAGDVLTYSVQLANGGALPAWLKFMPATKTFSGTPGNNDVGRFDVKVTATDLAGLSVSDVFNVQVNNTNDAPSLATAVPDQIANVGGLFSYAIPANTFLDVDVGDSLTYSATLSDGKALPAWLIFNTMTRTFSGTPLSSDASSVSVKIKATDNMGAIATDVFDVVVTFSVINGSSGIDNLNGTNADDQINGLAGNDKLFGLDGNDTLNGGIGIDEMRGGKGDDIYFVDNIGDVIIENVNEGADSIQSTVTYTMPANVEKLILIDTAAINATGNSADNILIGNSGINTLTGGAGNDFLDGAAGADKLYGGTGNDTYVLDNAGDLVSENAGEGLDVVNSSISYTLTTNVEVLVLTGSLAVNGTGNASQNLLIGNGANNILNGGNSNDLMQGANGDDSITDTSGNNLFDGGLGNDVLTGGTGRDLFIGGRGNDTINTSSGADVIAFNRGDGKDVINASTGKDNTLSLGHGIKYADLFFTKSVNDLILQTGSGEQVTLKDWYLSINNHSVANLQIVIEGTSDYVSTSNNVLNNHKIELFNFDGLVTAFDQARAATPGLSSWALSNSLLNFHTSGNDTSAIGGDLTYQYAMNGNLSTIAMNPALILLAGAAFGVSGQNLQLTSALLDGSPILV